MAIIKWTGLEVAALRMALRDTQEQFADRIGCSVEAVGKWERRGAGIVLGAKYSECMDTACRRLDDEQKARFAQLTACTSELPSQKSEGLDLADVVPGSHAGTGSEVPAHDGGDPTNRREALQVLGISALSGGVSIAGLVNDAARESTVLMNAVERSPADPDSLHDAAEDLYRLASDYATDPDVARIFVRLTALRDQIAAAIQRIGRVADLRDLYVLFSATCVLLASVSHDLAEPQAAMAQARAASRFAELAGHRALLSWVFCTRAMIASWWGRPGQVLREVDRAGAKYGVAGLRLRGLEARAHAQCGNRESALAALHAARSHRERWPGQDELADLGPIFTFSSARQHYYDATTFARLGDWKKAEREAEAVVGCYRPNPASSWPVTLTLAQADLARARLHIEGPRVALDTLLPALEVSAVQRLPQFHVALRAIHKDLLSHPAAADPDGRMMLDAIRTFAMDTTTTKVEDGRLA
ncbi:helix-turn-helix domain-containing protein [Nocardia flavorosea]|uniref:Transcriptional regulator n=1 Tax=Nocardia flavorosea TaxID=53429 RepID=A0A846YP17_9NOCA|nr:transcriptional regulator [Nocardia flavorosea]NKY60523.1 transcriptional regulator [Nocardia flavorosea]